MQSWKATRATSCLTSSLKLLISTEASACLSKALYLHFWPKKNARQSHEPALKTLKALYVPMFTHDIENIATQYPGVMKWPWDIPYDVHFHLRNARRTSGTETHSKSSLVIYWALSAISSNRMHECPRSIVAIIFVRTSYSTTFIMWTNFKGSRQVDI